MAKTSTVQTLAIAPPPVKTQAQIYEENWMTYPTVAEWANLFGIPAEQVPLKLGKEQQEYEKKYPPVVTPPPTPPAEEGLGALIFLGLLLLAATRKK